MCIKVYQVVYQLRADTHPFWAKMVLPHILSEKKEDLVRKCGAARGFKTLKKQDLTTHKTLPNWQKGR